MNDIDQLIRAIDADPPKLDPPPWPSPWRRRLRIGVPLAAVFSTALVLLWPTPPPTTPSTTWKGAGSPPDKAAVDLRVGRFHDGVLSRMGQQAAVGDHAVFRVSASSAETIYLRVRGPAGTTPLATIAAGTEPADVYLDGDVLGYPLPSPGRYTFEASTNPEACVAPGCMMVVVEAQ